MVEGAALGTWELQVATGAARFNTQWMRMLGYAPEQVEQVSPAGAAVHPEDLPAVEALLAMHLHDPSVTFRAELRMLHARGHWAWVLTAGAVVERDSAGQPRLMSGVHLDVDRAKRAEAATREARERAERALSELRAYQAALDKHAIVSVTDLSGDHARQRALLPGQPVPADELVGRTHRFVNSGTHPPSFWAEMWRSVNAGRSWNAEVCSRARDGTLYWADTTIVPVQDAQSQVIEHVAIRTDITQRKQLEEQLRSAALTDGLTQLPNRASILGKLHDAVLRARRLHDYHFAVLFRIRPLQARQRQPGHDVATNCCARSRAAPALRCAKATASRAMPTPRIPRRASAATSS
jgi:PAS domain S-box-containing protein